MTKTEPFGVYVHWPFCLAKCPYCDFNSHVRRGGIDQGNFVAAYLAELSHFASLAPGRNVSSIFFGGGTPSLMAPETVGAILDRIAELWTVAPDAEITLEANPTSVEAGRFAGYRAAGVNRVSLGVQSLDDASLKSLGRMHTAAEALAALAIAKRNFERVSFDLIYARQGQTLDAWREELTQALTHAQDHLSLYQLTIEPGTPFAALHAPRSFAIPRASPPTRFRTMRGLEQSRGTISFIGAATTMPASAQAPIAASPETTANMPSPSANPRKPGCKRSPPPATASSRTSA
jgi:putative oxygen-independent coproporphyrinogen III oxidase